MTRAARALLFGMLATLCLAFGAQAQDTGYISGSVTDKSGAAVVGAQVVLTASAGGLTRNTTTNTDGAYVISGLPGGTYDVVVTAKGFQKYAAQKVVLDVAAKIRVDVQLTVGAVNEEVVVTGENVAQVETQSSEISDTITGKQVNQLVLNGRNFTQLVTLSPGVVNQQGYDEGIVGITANVSFAINGGRVEYNNWELDGGDNMDNGSNSTLNVYPNPEAIAEVNVLTSNYGAQYGRNGSGTVEVETKSGGNSFHGSAFEYLRNDMFNARPWSSGNIPGDPNPPYKKHDFGYTLGGPIYIPHHYNADKKKTFFFWSQEWRRQKNPYSILQNVPSNAERGGNFSELCPTAGVPFVRATDMTTSSGTVPYADCPGTVDHGVFNGDQQEYNTYPNNTITPSAVGTALLAEIPTANTTDNGFPAVGTSISLPTTWREELIRVDHNITDKYRLTFRYIHDSWQTQTQNPLWGNGSSFENINTNFVGPGTSFVARMNANFSPTLLNEFVASYTADHIFLTALNNPAVPSGFAMTSLFDNNFDGKLPSIVLGSNTAYGGGFNADTGYFPWNNANPTYTYRDNVTKIVGVHTLQFGAYFVAAQKNEDNSPYNQGILTFSSTDSTTLPNGQLLTTGNGFADLLLGNVAQYTQTNQTVKYYNRWKVLEPYFQDDWRMNKHLTLNLGLRFSLYGTYREKYQHAFDFDPNTFVANGSPTIDYTGNVTGQAGALESGSGNPFNGIIQCGGKGGTTYIPANVLATFPGATVGPSSNAGCMSGHLFNPAPRIGFAWDPKGDGRMAVRGGYGIFFEHTNGNEGNTESLEGSAPLAFTANQFNVASGFGTCPASSEGGYTCIGGAGLLFPLNVTNIPNQVKWPYVQQWNLSIQKELPSHIITSIAYVGSKGTHLTLESDLNQLEPFTGTNPFAPGQGITSTDCSNFTVSSLGLPTSATLANGTPVPNAALPNLWVACGNTALPYRPYIGYGNITSLQDQANSIYHSLQATAKRTVGDFTFSVAYTYSHSIDDSSDRSDNAFVNAYDFAANRASSTFDQRHSAAISYVYAFPFFKAPGLMRTLLGGWQASGITIAQTGTPFSVTNGMFGDSAGVGNGVGTGSRPDLVGNPYAVTAAQKAAAAAAGDFGELYYNPNAFAQPTGLTFGDVGRDTLYYPGRLNFDFGLFKRFVFGGENSTKELDFRWENFNLFNHTQFNSINASNSSSAFLVLNGAHDPRLMQFGLRLQF